MRILKRFQRNYGPEELVRLVKLTDEGAMAGLTNPLVISSYRLSSPSEARYVPMRERATSDRGQVAVMVEANSLRWPRPSIIPVRLVPADFDDESVDPRFNRRSSQESDTSEAFRFHSGAGAVPMLLPHRGGKPAYSEYGRGLVAGQSHEEEMACVNEFVDYIRSGSLAPLWVYLDRDFDTDLNLALQGRYREAMNSREEMQRFAEEIEWLRDRGANMDW